MGTALLCIGSAATAGTPSASEAIAVAKASVHRAEQSGAPEYAPVDLAASRDKLARADKAVANRKIDLANQLADEANLDAQVAEATAVREKSRRAAADFDASMVTLRQESTRPTQATP